MAGSPVSSTSKRHRRRQPGILSCLGETVLGFGFAGAIPIFERSGGSAGAGGRFEASELERPKTLAHPCLARLWAGIATPERGRPELPARDVCFALCQFVPAPTLIGRGAGPAGQL